MFPVTHMSVLGQYKHGRLQYMMYTKGHRVIGQSNPQQTHTYSTSHQMKFLKAPAILNVNLTVHIEIL